MRELRGRLADLQLKNSQNYNRYAYVLNNPLSYSDPSSYFFKKLFKKLLKALFSPILLIKKVAKWVKENWKTVLSIVVAFVAFVAFVGVPAFSSFALNGIGSAFAASVGSATMVGAKIAGAAIAGAISGAFNAAIHGGDLGDVLKGAIVGGLQGAATAGLGEWGGVVEKMSTLKKAALVVGHGVVGGVSNVAMGGKFKDGFISAAVGKAAAVSNFTGAAAGGITKGLSSSGFVSSGAAGVIARTLIAGVVGGTATALSGGKFANGAYTAAFQHLLNQEMRRVIMKATPSTLILRGHKMPDRARRYWKKFYEQRGFRVDVVNVSTAAEIAAALKNTYNNLVWVGHSGQDGLYPTL